MTLGEIFIAVARELLGMPPAKNPPRRRPPTALPSPAWDGGPFAPSDWTAEETPEPHRAAPPADPEAATVPAGVRRVSRDDVEEAYARAMRTAEAPPRRTAKARPAEELSSNVPAAGGRGSHAALPEGFVERLRNNPDAAREAFVYAEIFGPPKADRG